MKILLNMFLLVFASSLAVSAQSNSLSLLSSEKAGADLEVKADFSSLDAQALGELESSKDAILAKYPSFKSISFDPASKQVTATVKSGEIRGEDVVQVFQTYITSDADRELRKQHRELVRQSKSNN